MLSTKDFVKKGIFGILLLLSFFLVGVNIRLYCDNFNQEEKKKDILLQLSFLSNELKNNHLGERMQAIFPEGFVFTNVLYGLSWCELGIADTSKQIKTQALQEALYAYHQINTDEAKSIFNPSLVPKNGVFYTGWNNYLLSKILLLDVDFENNIEYKNNYFKQCESIAAALKNSPSPYLASYPYQSWPADMCVAMASIRNHDSIFPPKYRTLLAEWLVNVKANLDPKTNLIPHKTDTENGKTIEGARGCSISLILRLMSEIDTPFALEQYQLYKKQFVTTTFGLPSILEYPKGQWGMGDIDSGPVIFGVGFAGTIVSIGTFAVLGDNTLAKNQYKAINSLGLGYKTTTSKKYALGLLPISDAFIAWGRSSSLGKQKDTFAPSTYWRLPFHLFSFAIIVFIWGLFYAKKLFHYLLEKVKY
jgi:hypothetical protein